MTDKEITEKADFLVESLLHDKEVLQKAYEIIGSKLAELTEMPSKFCHYLKKDDLQGYCKLHMGWHNL